MMRWGLMEQANALAFLAELASATYRAAQMASDASNSSSNQVWYKEDELAIAFGGASDALASLDALLSNQSPPWPKVILTGIRDIRHALRDAVSILGWEPILDAPEV